MYTFLIVLLIIDAIVLATAILMQAGKGGGLAASFGGAGTSMDFLGVRQAGNLLTRMSWWGGGIFIGLSLVLALMSTRSRVPRSILDQQFAPPPAAAPAPSGAPLLPLEPIPTTPEQTPPPQP
ncbi:MAG TPA: preprotein translocase subunit SecG [Gemmatimonadaceae bacterium]|nr:preprotein translocase subunit SecG [Gemmatimonadaceae bacterium]